MWTEILPYIQRAAQLRSLGRYDDALVQLNKALQLDADSATIHRMIAQTFADLRQFDRAIHAANEGVRLAADDGHSHYVLASVLWVADKPKLALASAERSVELDALDADHQALLATIQNYYSRHAQAEVAARAALQAEPNHRVAISVLADVLRATGRGEEAEAIVRAQLGHDAEDDIAHCRLGWLALRDKRRGDAIRHFREALRIDPGYDDARQGLTTAIRSRSPIFGTFFLLLTRLADKGPLVMWTVLIGALLLPVLLGRLKTDSLLLKTVIDLVRYGSILFFVFWSLVPVFGLMILRGDPEGRKSMSRNEVKSSTWSTLVLSLMVVALAASPLLSMLFLISTLSCGVGLALAGHNYLISENAVERKVTVILFALAVPLCLLPTACIGIYAMRHQIELPPYLVNLGAIASTRGVWLIVCGWLIGAYGDDIARFFAGTNDERRWP